MSTNGAAAPDLERGRKLFSRPCRFVVSAVDERGFPDDDTPEVAFAGRSNAGKSSLLNALTGQRNLARTSRQPGRTQMINFFTIDGRLSLVDLPGYGFARAPKREVDSWKALIERYLMRRPNLRRVMLLIDARRGTMDSDRTLMTGLTEIGTAFQVVLTKIDAIKTAELEPLCTEVAGELQAFPAALTSVLATSARKGRGIDELRATLAELAGGK